MISLKKISRLPLTLGKNGISFSPKLKHDAPQIRYYKGNEAFFPTEEIKGPGHRVDFSKPLYYICRNVHFPADTPLFKERGIRFDVTILQGGARTIGHIHKKIGTKRPSELYQVLHGEALFYLQHPTKKEIRIIKAKKGAYAHIPGSYGHITINRSRKAPLVIANIFIDKKNASDYAFFKKTHGPALFPIQKGSVVTFKKNRAARSGYTTKRSTARPKKAPLYPFIQK